ncbi:hypothetical protein P8C59_008889 [Phyllachora maydis]|uniref:Uncharacterized protein n=1 Tax=Phyllachora maydis TaxID=1825666 RepID=A0AAD9MJ18_9PEZI|nr:hypothetical protein P8C59_008889 [Phyllachora maydis]
MLCSNRAEGVARLGQYSAISHPLPTQWFFDTILVPLPTWLSLALVLLVSVLRRSPGIHAHDVRAEGRPRHSQHGICLVCAGLCYVVIFVVVLMETIEIARDAPCGLGRHLVPRVYPGWELANGVLWLTSLVVTVLKLGSLRANFLGNGPFLAREGTAYPVSDQVADLGVLVAAYIVLLGLEIVLVFSGPDIREANAKGESPMLAGLISLSHDRFSATLLAFKRDVAKRQAPADREHEAHHLQSLRTSNDPAYSYFSTRYLRQQPTARLVKTPSA